MTRALRRLALVAAAALLPIVGPGQLHGACATGQVQIAVVVDFGTARSVSAACVGAGTRDNGATVLAARASQLGTPLPRYNASGLLCAIDGYPSEGCGEQTGSHYAYWSYWHGGASGWTYASGGPAGSRAQPAVVEGWRFQPAGAANPTDPAPRGSPDAATTCKAAPPPASSPTIVTGPTSRPAPETGGKTGGPTPPPSTPGAGAGETTSTDIATTTTDTGGSSTAVAAGPLAAGAPARVAARESGKGHDPPWGLLGGVGLVGAVGGAGALVARRRARLSA